MSVENIRKELKSYANKNKAKILQRFFKTGKGEYAEGDIFLGIVVPVVRKIAKQYQSLESNAIGELLKSVIHEERLLALLIMVNKYHTGNSLDQKHIYNFYLKHTKYINNWDLVDLTAPHIVGAFLNFKNKVVLYKLAKSSLLWERRISILATFCFIRKNNFYHALKIAKILLLDNHDLIHKAVGWMLREIGKRDMQALEGFLKKYCAVMPRTMLRYSVERFSEAKRQFYLRGG